MALTNMKVTATGKGAKTVCQARNQTVVCDEPKSMGGTDEGANPLETMLAALAGCENVIAGMVAKEIDFSLEGIDFEIVGSIDVAGLKGEPNAQVHWQTVTVNAKVHTSEDASRLKELQELTDQRCPVYATFKAAGVEMIANWEKA